jgi:hypothetical protein
MLCFVLAMLSCKYLQINGRLVPDSGNCMLSTNDSFGALPALVMNLSFARFVPVAVI